MKRTDRNEDRLRDQLRRDVQSARCCGAKQARALAIVHYPPGFKIRKSKHYAGIRRWFQIAQWLEEIKPELDSPVSKCLVGEFITFLKEEGLAVDKVQGSLVAGGLDALRKLVGMMDATVSALDYETNIAKNSGYEHSGIGFSCSGIECELAVHYSCPEYVQLHVKASDPRLAGLLMATGWQTDQADQKWLVKSLDLTSSEFFNKSSSAQSRLLEKFVQACANEIKASVK